MFNQLCIHCFHIICFYTVPLAETGATRAQPNLVQCSCVLSLDRRSDRIGLRAFMPMTEVCYRGAYLAVCDGLRMIEIFGCW